jgi:adenylate kinase
MVVIFTGQSGLDRTTYLAGLERLARERGHSFKVFAVGDLLYELKHIERGRILDTPVAEMNALLQAVFERIRRERAEYKDIAVNTHATFRWKRGLIRGTDYRLIEPLKPDVYVTMIDDIADVKRRLDQEYPDRFRYRDAMVWREEETLTTSLLAALTGRPHYVFARKHPISTLYGLLFEPDKPKVYTSFPISAVVSNAPVMAQIDEFKGEIARHFTVFDPYTISEKKLDYAVQAARRRGEDKITYEVDGGSMVIDIAELESILPDIDDQIIARDFHLVEQSDFLVAYYPCYDNGEPIHSAGREREVAHARDLGKPVYSIWQSAKEPGPFEQDSATKIFRTLGEARDFLVKKYSKA